MQAAGLSSCCVRALVSAQRSEGRAVDSYRLGVLQLEAQPCQLACIGFHSQQRIALDTEADSLHCYFEKVCLIQLSSTKGHWLVDPLANLDLQSLFDVVCSRRLVLHGADYDLRLLRRIGNFEPTDLFDTMIAARLVGKAGLGLAALVKEFFGVELSKASQKANWAIRPLPPEMIEYAHNDTRYLFEISDHLEADLHRLEPRREPRIQRRAQRIQPIAGQCGDRDGAFHLRHGFQPAHQVGERGPALAGRRRRHEGGERRAVRTALARQRGRASFATLVIESLAEAGRKGPLGEEHQQLCESALKSLRGG
jgi:hypothetical protein